MKTLHEQQHENQVQETKARSRTDQHNKKKYILVIVRDTLAVLGALLTVFALIDPWVTEDFKIMRFKMLISCTAVFVIVVTSKKMRQSPYRWASRVLLAAFLLWFWTQVPNAPIKLLDWRPSELEFDSMQYSSDLKSLDAFKAGMVHLLRNEPAKAEPAFRAATESRRIRPYAVQRLAYTLMILEKRTEALGAYDLAIKFAHDAQLHRERTAILYTSYHDRGIILRDIARDYQNDLNMMPKWKQYQDRARRSFQEALEYKPNDYKAFFNIGQIHFDREEYDAARENYLKSYVNNTQYYRPAYNIALIYAIAEDTKNCLKWLDRALQIEASMAVTAELEGAYEYLQKNPTFNDIIRKGKSRAAAPRPDR